jgi:opacity protein-like surface antigen
MKLRTLAAAISAASLMPCLASAEIHDARAMARGGAGMTMGEYNQAIYNPALINRYDDKDDFSFALNVGVIAYDQDSMVDELDDFSDQIEELEDNPPPAGPERDDAIDEAEGTLQSLSDKQLQLDAGGAVMVGIPNRFMPAAFVSRAKASAGVSTIYVESDRQVLEDIADGLADEDDLQSTADSSLVWLHEYGLMGGKTFDVSGTSLETGATVKVQTIELIHYSATPSDFDADDMTDSDNQESHTNLNLDLGALARLGDQKQYIVAATIENLIPKTFSGPNDTEYKMAPVITTAFGYQYNNWMKLEANIDLTKRNGFELLEDTQYLRAGAEFSAGRHVHLRAGYRTDIKSNVSNLMTAGIGITPFDRFNIDLSAAVGEGDTLGAALQLGFKI